MTPHLMLLLIILAAGSFCATATPSAAPPTVPSLLPLPEPTGAAAVALLLGFGHAVVLEIYIV